MKPTFSIIVPVYNVEKYLNRCIDSILSQAFKDFEVLLIDDGSKDKSGVICDEYAKKDNRVRVFHKGNGGVSSARNVGLDEAEGEWVCFVDSDDYLLPTALLNIQNALNKVDAVLYLFDYQQNDTLCRLPFGEEISKEEFIKAVLTYKLQTSPWAKIYRRSLLNGIQFNKDLVIGEDLLFNFEYIMQLSNNVHICHSNSIIYSYTYRESSVMQSKRIKEKYKSLNKIAIPIIKTQISDGYHKELALFEATNIFQGNWKSMKLPSLKEDEILVDLKKSVGTFDNIIMERYVALLKRSSKIAHVYLKYRYFRSSIMNVFRNI